MGRHGNSDVQRAFEEFQDEENPTKCNKVRCIHCGFVRAKNTTRQVEHLQECTQYMNSPDYVESMQLAPQPSSNGANGTANMMSQSPAQPTPTPGQKQYLMGQRPNPNLQVNRRGPNKRTRDGQIRISERPMPPPPVVAPAPTPTQQPSLTNYLVTRDPASFSAATQQPFLSHAGCGTLSTSALSQWLAQDSHVSRAYIGFVGQLIGKIRLPAVQNTQLHPLYRAMDLLISALNNVRREMNFFDVTATKYNLQLVREEPNPITKAYLDLFVASSSPGATLLEGMVVLWATEHCYRSSWTYASTFTSTLNHPILSSFGTSTDSHNAALHQSLIPNWTSPAFAKFVDACRAVVDELANAQTSGNGREEMARCEGAWKQVLWLWEKSWPDVDGMGEESESANAERLAGGRRARSSTTHTVGVGGGHPVAGAEGGAGGVERDAEAADDDVVIEVTARRESGIGSPSYVSPYGGTGLGAVEAANNA